MENVANNEFLNLEETERSDIVEKEENIGMVEDERDEPMVEVEYSLFETAPL